MKHLLLTVCTAVVLLATPALALAMHHNQGDHQGHAASAGDSSHNSAMSKAHAGMSADGEMMMLESVSVGGVTGMGHIKDVSAAMAKMGMPATHHFMLMLHDDKNDKSIETGVVAVKIKGPDGQVSDPIKLVGMDGHFGADVSLPAKGAYVFTVGSRLDDGQTRTFAFNFDYK